MKEITIKLYSFDELPEKSKDKVMEKHRYDIAADSEEYDWKDMWAPTIKKFEELFNVDLGIDSRYGWRYRVTFNEEYFFDNGEVSDFPDCNGQYSIRMDELSGEKLRNYIDTQFSSCMKRKTFFGKNYGKRRISRIFKEWDNCPLTGCCSDISILEPIAEYLNHKQGDYGWKKADGTINKSWKSYTYEDLMEACADSIIKEIESSIDYYSSDEYIAEEIANRFPETEYFENGDEF